jgi:hypothetical protein
MNSKTPIPLPTGIDHDPSTDAYRTSFDWADDVPLCTTVLTLVAEATGVDPTRLPPLNDAVDPDALDGLFAPREDGSSRPPGDVSFAFADADVAIRADGTVTVRRR